MVIESAWVSDFVPVLVLIDLYSDLSRLKNEFRKASFYGHCGFSWNVKFRRGLHVGKLDFGFSCLSCCIMSALRLMRLIWLCEKAMKKLSSSETISLVAARNSDCFLLLEKV